MTDADVAIIGGGPAGLSAALFTAKNGLDMRVFDTDDTVMHAARLYNYLGVENVRGDEFIDVAREQGADRHQGETVTGVERTDKGFQVTTDEDEYDAPYVVLASGCPCDLAKELGCELGRLDTVNIYADCETSVENAYATGEAVWMPKIQAAISVGHGATAAIDILSKERNEPFHDYDKAVHAQPRSSS
jgi:thioredoxin reductase (NADPH)